jgi:hypothetical protein
MRGKLMDGLHGFWPKLATAAAFMVVVGILKLVSRVISLSLDWPSTSVRYVDGARIAGDDRNRQLVTSTQTSESFEMGACCTA